MKIKWQITLFIVIYCTLGTLSWTSEVSHRSQGTGAEPVAQETLGVLQGQVLLDGSRLPQATQVENTTDPQECGTTHSLENILVGKENRGIQNVIVALRDVPRQDRYPTQPGRLLLDNRNCRFQPHAAVLTTGSTIEAVNSDSVSHSVHLYGLRNVNLVLAPQRSKDVGMATRPGYVIVKCDIHGWMQAYIRVDDHPFHAVTDADGRFRIEGIPAGTYTVEFWHEHFGDREGRVTIRGDADSNITFHYSDQILKGEQK